MGPPRQVIEFCRKRAVELIRAGESKQVIARVLGVSRNAINRWWRLACAGEDLAVKTSLGRRRRLGDEQLQRLAELLKEGPEAHGWQNNLWTSLRVREVIRRHFGITFCRSQVWHILTDYLHWTAKRPVQEQKAKDERAIAAWAEVEFPRLLREAAERGAFLVFVDETGFMMYPTIRKSFSPRGEAPVNKVTDPHGRISTIGAIAVSPQGGQLSWHYYMLEDNNNFRGPSVVAFMKQLSATITGPMIIIWDQIIIHSCAEVEEYLGANRRIKSEPFPAYAPELNPVDGAWFYIKYDRLPNFSPVSMTQLRKAVRAELERLRTRPNLLRSFIRESALPPFQREPPNANEQYRSPQTRFSP
jgi:transposase